MSPILPVRQNAHAIAQPTCVEMQKVMDGVSGMNTDSIRWPSARRSRNFSVPSIDRSRWTSSGVVNANSAASCSRSARGTSDMPDSADRSVTPWR